MISRSFVDRDIQCARFALPAAVRETGRKDSVAPSHPTIRGPRADEAGSETGSVLKVINRSGRRWSASVGEVIHLEAGSGEVVEMLRVDSAERGLSGEPQSASSEEARHIYPSHRHCRGIEGHGVGE